MLCLTGLPLIFHHEIDELLGYAPKPEGALDVTPKSTIDRVAKAALSSDPGKVVQYIAWDKDEPDRVIVYTNGAVDGKPDDAVVRAFGSHSANLLGVVLYWPFTRRLEFGTIRRSKTRRVAWLDWHDLIGITTVVWAVVVGGTGVINTWAELMLNHWRTTELASMVAPYAGKPPPAHLASLDLVVENAALAAPGMEVAFIAFPGTPFSSPHHFAAFMRGNQPLTSRLLTPILLDGETAKVADARDLPLYLKALFISQPLHFGDYGGTPLKIIWALLDLFTIVVIGTGLYLWCVEWLNTRRGSAMLAAHTFGVEAK